MFVVGPDRGIESTLSTTVPEESCPRICTAEVSGHMKCQVIAGGCSLLHALCIVARPTTKMAIATSRTRIAPHRRRIAFMVPPAGCGRIQNNDWHSWHLVVETQHSTHGRLQKWIGITPQHTDGARPSCSCLVVFQRLGQVCPKDHGLDERTRVSGVRESLRRAGGQCAECRVEPFDRRVLVAEGLQQPCL